MMHLTQGCLLYSLMVTKINLQVFKSSLQETSMKRINESFLSNILHLLFIKLKFIVFKTIYMTGFVCIILTQIMISSRQIVASKILLIIFHSYTVLVWDTKIMKTIHDLISNTHFMTRSLMPKKAKRDKTYQDVVSWGLGVNAALDSQIKRGR